MRKLRGYGPSLIVLATAMLVLLLGPSAIRELTYKQTQAKIVQASDRLEQSRILDEINQAYRDIATLVEPSVVHISAETPGSDSRFRRTLSSGSGWIFDEEGHIVTNYHVVRGSKRMDVQLSSGELRAADLLGYDESTDIAVLKIPSGRLHPAGLADPTDTVQQGDMVFAFGSPFDFRFSMSSGIVSGKGRSVGVIRDHLNRPGFENFIQVDAAINPGNSGGPLTNHRGRVIGMNSAIATGGSRNGFEEGQFAGIGLAIPLEMIIPVVNQIIDTGVVEKGYLGVRIDDLASRIGQSRNYRGEGVWVFHVVPNGPAAEAGLRADDIITHVNGKPIASRPQLQSIISSVIPGEAVNLTIWRSDPDTGDSETLTLTVTLGRLDLLTAHGILPLDQSPDQIVQLGIAKMSTATRENTADRKTAFQRGVLIEETVPGTEFAKRVPPGSIILRVKDYPVSDVESFLTVLRNSNLLPDQFDGVRIEIQLPNGDINRNVLLYVEQQ